jgi:outer membrane protein
MTMTRSQFPARLVAVLLVLGAAGIAPPSSAQTPAQTPPVAPLKIGVFDSKGVFDGAAEGQRLQKFLNDKRETLKNGISAKEQEVRALQQKISEGEFTLAAEKKTELQKEAQRKMVELDSARQEATNNLKLELDDVQSQLEHKLIDVVSELGREQGYALIIEKNSQAVFAADSLDITPLIVERFNRKYPARSEPAAPGK